MSICFPLTSSVLEKAEGIVAVDYQDGSMLLAVVTSKYVAIRDTNYFKVPEISRFERSDESLASFGPNTWVQFITHNKLAFGTSSGCVFVSKISNQELSEPVQFCISKVILSTFSAFACLGICTATSDLIFINENADVVYTRKLSKTPTGIRSAQFHSPATLSCIIGDKPYFATINTLAGNAVPMLKAVPINNVIMTAWDHTCSSLAVLQSSGTVIIINTGQKRRKPVTVCHGDPSDIITKMFWAGDSNSLVIIKQSGTVLVWMAVGQCGSSTVIDALKPAVCMTFDGWTNRLYFSDGKSLQAIDFMQNMGHLSVTNHEILDLLAGKSVYKNTSEIYPIKKVAVNSARDIIAITNLKGFRVLKRDCEPGPFTKCDIDNIGIIGKYIFVFTSDLDNYALNVYSPDGDLLVKRVLKHAPLNVASDNDRLVVSCPSAFTIVTLNSAGPNGDPNFTRIGSLFLSMKAVKTPTPIINAIPSYNGDVLVHADDTVKSYMEEKVIMEDVNYIWNSSNPLVIFMQMDKSVVVKVRDTMVRIQSMPCFSDGYSAYSLAPDVKFGNSVFVSKTFGYYFLTKNLNEPNMFRELAICYCESERLNKILEDTTTHALGEGEGPLWMKSMEDNFPNDAIIATINVIIPKLNSQTRQWLVCESGYDWAKYLPQLNDDAKTLILLTMKPDKFVSFDCPERNTPQFITVAISEHQFIKGFLSSVAIGTDFCVFLDADPKIKKFDLNDSITFFYNEKKEWEGVETLRETLIFMASVMLVGGFSTLALGLFTVIPAKEKISALLLTDSALVEQVRTYIGEYTESKHAGVLRAALEFE